MIRLTQTSYTANMKVQKIPAFVPTLVEALLAIVKEQFVNKITDENLKILITDALAGITATAYALADEDTDDIVQIKKIWMGFVNKSAAGFIDTEVADAINKIPNETAKLSLQTLRVPVVQMIRVVTDDITPNNEQLEALWKNFVKDPAVQNIFLNMVDEILNDLLKDPTLKGIVLGIWAIVKQVIKDKLGSLIK